MTHRSPIAVVFVLCFVLDSTHSRGQERPNIDARDVPSKDCDCCEVPGLYSGASDSVPFANAKTDVSTLLDKLHAEELQRNSLLRLVAKENFVIEVPSSPSAKAPQIRAGQQLMAIGDQYGKAKIWFNGQMLTTSTEKLAIIGRFPTVPLCKTSALRIEADYPAIRVQSLGIEVVHDNCSLGVYVVAVVPNGHGDKMGIQVGDLVKYFNNCPTLNPGRLLAWLKEKPTVHSVGLMRDHRFDVLLRPSKDRPLNTKPIDSTIEIRLPVKLVR